MEYIEGGRPTALFQKRRTYWLYRLDEAAARSARALAQGDHKAAKEAAEEALRYARKARHFSYWLSRERVTALRAKVLTSS